MGSTCGRVAILIRTRQCAHGEKTTKKRRKGSRSGMQQPEPFCADAAHVQVLLADRWGLLSKIS